MSLAKSIRPGPSRYIRSFLGTLAAGLLLGASVASAAVDEPKARTAWSNFGVCGSQATCNTFSATMGCDPLKNCQILGSGPLNTPARDFQSGNTDYTSSTSPNSETEISSGMGTGTSVGTTLNCNPACPIPGTVSACSNCVANGNCATVGTCGPHPSAYYSYYYDDSQKMAYLFMRMRVALNPTNGNQNNRGNGWLSSHFNFLLDFDGDGFKEFWLDLDGGFAGGGNNDIVNVYYADNNTQQIQNTCDMPGIRKAENCALDPTGTPANRVNRFLACTDETNTGCALSITRAVKVLDPNAPNDWFIDIQIPVAALTAYNGAVPSPAPSFPPWSWDSRRSNIEANQFSPLAQTGLAAPYKGAGPFAYMPSGSPDATNVPTTIPNYLRFNVATSQSATDPLQKDFLLLGYSSPTPVTLGRFTAMPYGAGHRVEWTTTNETGNAGFDLFAAGPSGWVKLNDELIPSRGGDSFEPQDYSFEVPDLGPTEFRLVDVAIDGKERRHGAFESGREYGSRRSDERVDWTAVAAESAAKRSARAATARDRALEASRAASAKKGTPPGLAGYPEARFQVSADGLYRVTYEQLVANGVDLSGVPASLFALETRTGPVPVRVEGGKGSVFGPGGFVEFYGEAVRSLYTRTNVYRFYVHSSGGEHVKSVPAPPGKTAPAAWYLETAETHRDRVWSPASPTSDPWYDDYIYAGRVPVTRNYVVALDNVATSASAAASVSVGLWGGSIVLPNGRDHRVQASLNGELFADRVFTGISHASLEGGVPVGTLREGANTLTLRMPADTGASYEINHLDRYSVTYPRAFVAREGRLAFTAAAGAFRVTGLPSSSVVVYRFGAKGMELLTNYDVAASAGGYAVTFRGSEAATRYVVSSQSAIGTPEIVPVPATSDPTSGPARYVIVTHPDFASGLDALVAAREAQGLTVKVVDVRDVYERFSGGVVDPQAIRDFVAHAVGTGTEYVLLVGGDSYDYLNNTGTGSVSFIPTFYVRTSDRVGFAPADGVFADLDGDLVADVAIGRFPVRTSAELAAVVAKTLEYPASASSRRAVFVADRRDGSDWYAAMADNAIGQLGSSWAPQTAYVDQIGAAGARQAMISAVNSGMALTTYIGHSDVTYWSFDRLFTAGDISKLTNAGKPTIVSQFGCWNTFFVHPTLKSLSDQLLLAPGRGASAVLGPSTLNRADSDQIMSEVLSAHLAEPGITIGKALAATKAQVVRTNPDLIDGLRSTNLMGDPALVIP